MSIVQTLTKHSFIDAFKSHPTRANQFSYEALESIYDYMEDYSLNSGENVEFDLVAICCEWVEMSWSEAASAYNIDLSECSNDDERIQAVSEYLWENTHSIDLANDSFVFVQF